MQTLADPARPWMGPAAGVPKAARNSKISAFSSLPAPLTEECVDQFLTELAPGSKKAVQSCLECWKDNRLSNDDLLSFLKSISFQSKTLEDLFSSAQVKDASFEVASADDMAELRALAAGFAAPSYPPMHSAPAAAAAAPVMQKMAVVPAPFFPASSNKRNKPEEEEEPAPAVAAAPLPAIAIEIDTPHTVAKQAKRTRRPKITEPTEEESRLMWEWSARRVTEIKRRQDESCASLSKSAYLSFVVGELRRRLPSSELAPLLDEMRKFTSGQSTPEDFGLFINGLVEKHSIVAPLSFQEEVNVRPKVVKKRVALSVGSDAMATDEMEDAVGAQGLASSGRHHHPSPSACAAPGACCNGGIKGESGEHDDDDACCPVCKSSPVEDERWVKCDGCSTWYHQICVLFNELAHGKSVRFFCRTPGCRKRGSRQLNRRQRKPCYPMSEGLETTPLAQTVSAACLPVARQDRSVVARVVASESTSRGGADRRRNKTVMVFQHTMTGSDLLFLTALVEEQAGRLTITNCDSNGLYEESYSGERAAVEAAVVEGILTHARLAGFEAVSMTNPGEIQDSTLFHCRPAVGAWAPGDAQSTYERAAMSAKNNGAIAGGIHRDGGMMTVKLRPSGQELVVDEVDMLCKVAVQRESLLGMMALNDYRFDSLQSAKFSSMMIVYHLAKGWRKDVQVSFASAYTRGGATMAEEEEEEEVGMETEMEQEQAIKMETQASTLSRGFGSSIDLLKHGMASSMESGAQAFGVGGRGGNMQQAPSYENLANFAKTQSFEWGAGNANGLGSRGASFDMGHAGMAAMMRTMGSRGASFDLRNHGAEQVQVQVQQQQQHEVQWNGVNNGNPNCVEQRFMQLIEKHGKGFSFDCASAFSLPALDDNNLPAFEDGAFWDSVMQ